MIYLFIISITINIISLSKLYLDSSIKKKFQTLTSDHNTLKAEYKQLKKELEASYRANYKEMMRIYIELKKQNFNDNYIYNYICKK